MMMMTMTYTKAKHKRYYIRNEEREVIVWFDSLNTAALVLRYLNNGSLDDYEIRQVHAALKGLDSSINETESKEGDTE